tara:strand:+ start:980 stop:1120 length:141 start_codon:yes stop_codon:yes gene_type:complete
MSAVPPLRPPAAKVGFEARMQDAALCTEVCYEKKIAVRDRVDGDKL